MERKLCRVRKTSVLRIPYKVMSSSKWYETTTWQKGSISRVSCALQETISVHHFLLVLSYDAANKDLNFPVGMHWSSPRFNSKTTWWFMFPAPHGGNYLLLLEVETHILLWQHIAPYVSACVNQGELKKVGRDLYIFTSMFMDKIICC